MAFLGSEPCIYMYAHAASNFILGAFLEKHKVTYVRKHGGAFNRYIRSPGKGDERTSHEFNMQGAIAPEFRCVL